MDRSVDDKQVPPYAAPALALARPVPAREIANPIRAIVINSAKDGLGCRFGNGTDRGRGKDKGKGDRPQTRTAPVSGLQARGFAGTLHALGCGPRGGTRATKKGVCRL